jgi:hypothetical protein
MVGLAFICGHVDAATNSAPVIGGLLLTVSGAIIAAIPEFLYS